MLSLPDFKYKQILVHFAGDSGEKIHLRNDNIVISDANRATIVQHSLYRLFALFIVGETSISTPFLQNARKFGFPIILLKRNLAPFVQINCRSNGNTSLRRLQYTMPNEKKTEIAKSIIRQKIDHQIELLSNLPYKSVKDIIAISRLKSLDLTPTKNVQEIMGVEGIASREFFNSYFRNLDWSGRFPREKPDSTNLLLDIGYTYLFNFIDAMTAIYGFDSYVGFLHQTFYQRKSLVCDLMEPFRHVIDKTIRKLHEHNQIIQKDFKLQNGKIQLDFESAKKYTRHFLKGILAEKEDIFRWCQNFYRGLDSTCC